MFDKKAVTSVPINSIIATRWSGRCYDAQRDVTQEQIQTLLEAARWAPSCYGDEPWRFLIFHKSSHPDAWQQAYDCLMEGNQAWAVDAPLLMLGVADTLLSKNGKPNRWGEFDTGAATMNLCLQATELGLMVHQMGGYYDDKAREVFHIPEQFTLMSMMSIGYQLAEDAIPEEHKEREYSARQRSSLSEIAFHNEWGKSVSFD